VVTLAILQARTGSTRLPGKVLAPILGRPLILRLIDRIRDAEGLDHIVVATTVHESDSELVETLEREGVLVRRGPVEDVLSRFLGVLDEFQPETFVRLTGDNPLLDATTIDQAVQAHRAVRADYTTNGLSHRFPHGLNVEVVQTAALRRLADRPLTAREREHVTIGIVERPEEFALSAVTQDDDNSELRWTVDLPEDLTWAREVFAQLHPGDPRFGQVAVVDLLRRRPDLRRTVRDAP